MTEIRDNDIRLKAEKLLLQVSCFHRSYERRRQHAQGEQFFISVGHETRSKRIAACMLFGENYIWTGSCHQSNCPAASLEDRWEMMNSTRANEQSGVGDPATFLPRNFSCCKQLGC